MKILLVDDNKHFINAFRFLLQDSFSDIIDEIYEVYDGQECLDFLKEQVVDVIFMDIDMPVMNGKIATMSAVELYRDIKIIAVSFHDEMEQIQQMIEAGARNYLIKEEINKENLMRILR